MEGKTNTTRIGIRIANENRWSLQGMIAPVTGGTKGFGYQSIILLSNFKFV